MLQFTDVLGYVPATLDKLDYLCVTCYIISFNYPQSILWKEHNFRINFHTPYTFFHLFYYFFNKLFLFKFSSESVVVYLE